MIPSGSSVVSPVHAEERMSDGIVQTSNRSMNTKTPHTSSTGVHRSFDLDTSLDYVSILQMAVHTLSRLQ